MLERQYNLSHALSSLRPGSEWVLRGEEYSGLEWQSEGDPPTEEELLQEVNRLQAEWDKLEYQRKRKQEYPDVADYLDGVVKGDQAQIEEYIQKCLAVKEKYPKT